MWLIQNSRDEIVNFISHWSFKLELPVRQFLIWLAISPNRYYDWKKDITNQISTTI